MLNNNFKDFSPVILKTDIVGPKAGEQLRISGFQAMLWALLMIMIYILEAIFFIDFLMCFFKEFLGPDIRT